MRRAAGPAAPDRGGPPGGRVILVRGWRPSSSAGAVAVLVLAVLQGPPTLSGPADHRLAAGPATASRRSPRSPAPGACRLGELPGHPRLAGEQHGPRARLAHLPDDGDLLRRGRQLVLAERPGRHELALRFHDGAQTWSVLPVPAGITFTSALACGSAGGLRGRRAAQRAQPRLHQHRHRRAFLDDPPAPGLATAGSATSLRHRDHLPGAGVGQRKTDRSGFRELLAALRLVATTDGGRRFTAVPFIRRVDADISCPTTTHCVAIGVFDDSAPRHGPALDTARRCSPVTAA